MNSSDRLSGSSSLHGRTAVVTEGAPGIGRAIAEVFQGAGARVCILTGMRCVGRLRRASFRQQIRDLESVAEIESAAEAIRSGFGDLDFWAEIWGRIMSINLRAPFLLTRAVLGCFPEAGGTVINVSSMHAPHAFARSLPMPAPRLVRWL